MIDVAENYRINARLSELYIEFSPRYLEAYIDAFRDNDPPMRINEFGIIDETCYDRDKGILIVAKETDGWSNEDYANGLLFRKWMHQNTQTGLSGHAKKHPTMWYNLSRWVSFINNQEQSMHTLAEQYTIEPIGTVAYTNMNKVRGGIQSKKEFYKIAQAGISGEILQCELDILQPKIIVCCGTYGVFQKHNLRHDAVVVEMPHPGAYKSKIGLLEILKSQLTGK